MSKKFDDKSVRLIDEILLGKDIPHLNVSIVAVSFIAGKQQRIHIGVKPIDSDSKAHADALRNITESCLEWLSELKIQIEKEDFVVEFESAEVDIVFA